MEWSASFIEHSGASADHKALAWVGRFAPMSRELTSASQDAQTVTVQYFRASATMNSFMVVRTVPTRTDLSADRNR